MQSALILDLALGCGISAKIKTIAFPVAASLSQDVLSIPKLATD